MNELNQFLTQQNLFIVATVAAIVLLAYLLLRLIRYLIHTSDDRKTAKVIKGVGSDYLRNIAIPDEIDGYVFVDYLILLPSGILVVDVQNYKGFLFGGEKMDQWTQMIGHKSYKFDNPLYGNLARVHVIRTHLNKVPVEGRVVFSNVGQFPKGIPQGVSMLNSLRQDVTDILANSPVPEHIQAAWNQLKSMAKEARFNLNQQRIRV